MKKKQSEAGKKAVTIREIKKGNIDEDTLSQSYDEAQERSRKLAAERMHVSERKVREVQGIDKKARCYTMAKP